MPRGYKVPPEPVGEGGIGPRKEADKQTAPPALFAHAANTYSAMTAHATYVETSEGRLLVYEGKLTDLIMNELYLSTPYYTSVTRLLKAMGCIRQLKRGGGSSPSQWLLMKVPSEAAFREHLEANPGAAKLNRYNRQYATREELAMVEQRLKDMVETLKDFERVIEAVVRAIPNEWAEEEPDSESTPAPGGDGIDEA